MKKIIALLTLAQMASANAFDDNPTALFNAQNNAATSMTIEWRVVDDVDKACATEAKKRGHKQFGYAVNACSYWLDNNCVIITKKRTSMHTLGHEVRHCFQGNWH